MHGKSTIQKSNDGTATWNGFLLDITKQKNSDFQLKEMTQKLQGINENIDGMVFNPISNRWKVSKDCSVNYIIKFKKN